MYRAPLSTVRKNLWGLGVAPRGDQNVEHVARLVDRPPQVMVLPAILMKHLIEVPLVPWASPAPAQPVGVTLAELAAPLVDGS